jgi:hypothetical protein
VLWDGDPLDATSRAQRVWIEGKQVFAYVVWSRLGPFGHQRGVVTPCPST